jgi:hypothetical protein
VLKSLQLLPGIQTSGEGSANLIVRGGNYDQNLILLDEAPVYNPSHALGFFSTFQPDAIKNVTLYKGCFPAQYGGRLSSVVDISMKEGNQKHFAANSSVGLLASRLSIEGPILKDKMSYIISTRYCYAGNTLNFLGGTIGRDLLHFYGLRNFNDKNEINFYDLNAKINYKLNDRNHFYLSAYNGRDHFYSYAVNQNNQLDWGNTTATFRWNHLYSTQLFSNFTLYSSNYNYSSIVYEDIKRYIWKSQIQETGLKYDFNYFLNQNNNIKFGLISSYQIFNPVKIVPSDTAYIVKPYELDRKKGFENALYIQNEQNIGKHFTINYGLRLTSYISLGKGTVYKYSADMQNVTDSTVYGNNKIMDFYYSLEPRLTVNYKINEKQSVKTGYSYVKQYLHLLSNSTVGLPTDIWLPPDNYMKPQTSHQFILGYYRKLFSGKFEFTTELYYKTLQNIIDFKNNADLFMNNHIETQILSGKGNSYGIETMIEKKTGRFSGWISYTLAKTKYQIAGINQNLQYSPRFDIRHNLSINLSLALSENWSVTSTFKITSGGFITIPAGSYIYDNVAFPYYTDRNGYELPLYHRLDIAIKHQSRKNNTRHYKSDWMLGIYNVYNRKNIYALFVRPDENYKDSKFYKMYLFGIVPTISYNFNF